MGGQAIDEGLGAQLDPGPEALWHAIRDVLDAVGRRGEPSAVIDDVLDAMVRALGADRVVLFLAQDGADVVIGARGAAGSLSAAEREEVSRTVVAEALRSEAPVAIDGVGDAGESATVLGIVSAYAVPLTGRARGVLYVDVRDPGKLLGPAHRELVRAVAGLLTTVVAQRLDAERVENALAAAMASEVRAPSPSLGMLLAARSFEPVHRDVMAALRSDSPILILGESGVGKTLVARAFADASRRTPVVRATLGSSDDLNTITSELFGHLRGSFSGATSTRRGLVEHAHGGTLILDEILTLPPHAQQLLLDFTQFGTFRPLGWDRAEPKHASVRIVAATNGDLDAAIADGRFRRDLYYRLAGLVVRIPPLRERRDEIPELARLLAAELDPSRVWALALPLRRFLAGHPYDWPGNVRELRSLVRRAIDRALADDPEATTLGVGHLAASDFGLDGELAPGAAPGTSFRLDASSIDADWARLREERARLDDVERRLLSLCLDAHDGVLSHVARRLGVPRTGLASRLQTLRVGDEGH